ncbi:MAG TPA: spore coat protein [Clostridiales bacterium]|nr:spore coat protein [Clostridiales bacterium]HBR07756.1 spore coat protein [Clostridiales bacterium]
MDDRTIMENLLLTTKGACDLYMHGTIESPTPNVHQTFNTALNSELCMQGDIYQQMSQKGWYTTDQANQQQINQVKQKYSATF